MCLAGSLVLMLFFQTSAQEEEAPDASYAQWYFDFFERNSKLPFESLVKENEDRRQQADEMQDDSARTSVNIEKGLLHLTRDVSHLRYELAMASFIEALRVADSANFKEGQIFSYIGIAQVFQDVGSYEKGLQSLKSALAFSEQLNSDHIHAVVLGEIGKVNAILNNSDEAFEYYSQALALKEVELYPSLHARILYNLAVAYELTSQYSKALNYHKQALALRRKMKDRVREAFLLNEIGEVYERMNNDERALANFKAALEVYRSIDNKVGLADSYNNVGALYLHQQNARQALANLELALEAGRASQSNLPVRRCYELLSLAYEAFGDYKKALENKNLYVEVNDFITKEANAQSLIEMQNRSVIEGEAKKVEKLEFIRAQREREIAEQKRIQIFLFITIGLGGIVVLLVWYMYLTKRRSNKQLKTNNETIAAQNIELQNLNATKDKFFSIIGHDLKGPLNSLTSFSNLLINYFDSLSKDEIQALAKDLDKSLKNLYSLLNNLLEWARSQTGNIDFAAEAFDISDVLNENSELLTTQATTKQITILHEKASPLEVYAHKQSITTVVRNLISNAIKFTPPGGAIRLTATKMNTEVVVSITDNGVGMNQSVIDKLFRIDTKHSTIGTANEKGTGLGLILCKDFIEKNGGRIWVTSDEGKGSVFYFTLPLFNS
jgi:signal transduction histidine kinase